MLVNTFITIRLSIAIRLSCFRVVSTSTTSTSYKSLPFLRFRSIFSIFFRGADRILSQNAVEDMTFVSVDRPCLFVMVRHNTFAHALQHTLHVMITEEQMSSFVGNEFDMGNFLYPTTWMQISQLTDGEQFDLIFCPPSVSCQICIHAEGYMLLNVCNGR